MKMTKTITAILGFMAIASAFGKAEDYNCKTMAVTIEPAIDKVQNFTLVREWKEDAKGYTWVDSKDEQGRPIKIPGEPIGGWRDGDGKNITVSNYFATCWLKFQLQKGKDYVITVAEIPNVRYNFSKVNANAFLSFGTQKLTLDGKTHYYVRSSDWIYQEADAVDFYFEIAGGLNMNGDMIGRQIPIMFQQRSVNDVLPEIPGSENCPYDIDVTKSGMEEIKAPVQDLEKRYYTAYRAKLKAGVEYVFIGECDGVMRASAFALRSGQTSADIPGAITVVLDQTTYIQRLTIRPTIDYEFVFRVWEIDDQKSFSVEGMHFSWTVDGKDPPSPVVDPVSAGVYSGKVTDLDEGKIPADFHVAAKILSDGSTNFTAKATIGETEITYGFYCTGVITGTTVVAAVSYDSTFTVALLANGNLSLSGDVYLDDGGSAKRFFFEGELGGRQVAWKQSFLQFNPKTHSAEKMGITSGPFAGEPEDSPTLHKVYNWGATHNVPVPMVISAEFNDLGDPLNTIAEAYLLDCCPSEAEVAAEAAKFTIVAFDPKEGLPVVGGSKDGFYANGKIAIRTSLTPGGTFDTSTKGDGSALFYRAFLVK